MTAAQLIEHVQSLGGRIFLDGDRLRIQAPKGKIQPELTHQLREHKAEILHWLDLDASSRHHEAADVHLAVVDNGTIRVAQTDADQRRAECEFAKAPNLEDRLIHHGIRIAVDKITGSALLVFTDAECHAVHRAAEVYRPYEIILTPGQRRELLQSLDHYQDLVNRKKVQSGE